MEASSWDTLFVTRRCTASSSQKKSMLVEKAESDAGIETPKEARLARSRKSRDGSLSKRKKKEEEEESLTKELCDELKYVKSGRLEHGSFQRSAPTSF